MGRSLELALENQEKLELNQDQVAQLQELKNVIDEDVAGLGEEMKLLRERIRGGEVARDEGMRQMEALRGQLITVSAPLRGRVQEILTAEQHARLQPMARQARPGMGRVGMGRVGVPRGGVTAFGGRGSGAGVPAQSLRGRNGGVGVQGRFLGNRAGGGLQQGFYGQGRGMVDANPGALRGIRARQAPRPAGYFRGGRGGGIPQGSGTGWNLP
jgi:hypothetical protein